MASKTSRIGRLEAFCMGIVVGICIGLFMVIGILRLSHGN